MINTTYKLWSGNLDLNLTYFQNIFKKPLELLDLTSA